MTIVVGTAGHIDHGKTTLLRALTGIDADRLPEERARGMTIDVGYAHLTFDDGKELDFVDVPGHDRLVGNMLVGAGEIDAAMIVVAADDGPRAQTIEHLELLDALRMSDGVVVITKTDAVSRERVAEVGAAVGRLIASTSLAGVPIIAVSAVAAAGAGLDELRRELADLSRRLDVTEHASGVRSRLAIDRVFSVRGRGTVVTGTLRGRVIEHGANLRVVGASNERTVRVREVQVHGHAVDAGGPGRVALNVAGDGVAMLERGVVLTDDPAVVATDRVLAALHPPAGAGLPRDRARVTVHLGTAHGGATVGRAGRESIDLGDDRVTALLRFDRPIAVAPGDRLVLRRASPAATLAGGVVLDPAPARGIARRRATPERLVALAAAPPGAAAWDVARLELHGIASGTTPDVAADVARALDAALTAEVGKRPAMPGAELIRTGIAELRRRVGPPSGAASFDRIVSGRVAARVDEGRLARDGDRVGLPGRRADAPSPDLLAAMDRLEEALRTPSPPSVVTAARDAGCPNEGIRRLERSGRIVRIDDDIAWAAEIYGALVGQALDLARRGPLTPAALRDATGTSRKYVLALLEDLDRRAILRRTPDGHLPGPRAPRPIAAEEPQPVRS